MSENSQVISKNRVLFFDGVCNLCNGFIDFVIRRDKYQQIYFSPLQSEVASRTLGPQYTESLPSVVYFRDGQVLSESTAALFVLKDIGGFWSLAQIFLVFPKVLRDVIYRWIARNRYRWFGKKQTCRIPSPEEKSRFL